MTVANLKIGNRKFVVVPKKEFGRIQRESGRYRRLVEEDQALGQLAARELKAFRKKGRKGIPWEQVKKELGL